MSKGHFQATELRVHLAGAIAYVPVKKDGAYWALFPNGLLATPARWRIKKQSEFLEARSTHLALLLVDHELVDRKSTSLDISTILEPWNPSPKLLASPLFPLTSSRRVLSHIFGYNIDFGFKDDELSIDDDVILYVPDMKTIRPRHAWADKRFDPGNQGFDSKGLSSAIRMNTGCLSVGSFFDEPDRRKLDFARVVVDSSGKVSFKKRVWNKPVVNHLIWTVPLAAKIDKLVITAKPLDKKGKDKELVLRVPQNRKSIDVAILHSEPELPALFIEDPFLAVGTAPLPDPDFELIHSIAVKHTKISRLRVPVNPDGSAGGSEKPCTGGKYEGFK
jgi:hypothetical protein